VRVSGVTGAIESIDDVLPPPAVGEDDASLLRESNRAKKQTGMLSIILVHTHNVWFTLGCILTVSHNSDSEVGCVRRWLRGRCLCICLVAS
jgi:hypothetical protein